MQYLNLFIVVALVGLIPAFGPPSWIFAVYFYHKYSLSFLAVVLITAITTTLSRVLLGYLTRFLRGLIPVRLINNLNYAQELLEKRKQGLRFAFGLFVFSPLPSAQLFEAAGLLKANLLSLGFWFMLGRVVSTSFYLFLSKAVEGSIKDVWRAGLTSPWAFTAEIVGIIMILGLLNIRFVIKKINSIKRRIKN